MPFHALSVDAERLSALHDGLARFRAGPPSEGGARTVDGDAAIAARRWFADEMRRDGLAVHTDAAGTVFGRLGPPDGASVMIGARLDAGDGALGCAVGLECVRALRAAGRMPRHPIDVVATTGARCGQGNAGDGPAGLETDETARRRDEAIRAFVEIHAEAGPALGHSTASVGVVQSLAGRCAVEVMLSGRADPAGTTPMAMRADAFVGLAEIGGALRTIAERVGTEEARITIGRVELAPNVPDAIVGDATFTVLVQDVTPRAMLAMRAEIGAEIARAAVRHGLTSRIVTRGWAEPLTLDKALAARLLAEASTLGIDARAMVSGAAHDARFMAAVAPTGVIAIPSRERFAQGADIRPGATLALNGLAALAEA
ncbi:M20/M25/M40 family metallo-hydrolase [Acuticoccus sp. M5D2P5]|uniref:M20/M25/M40 family metallo-hydrolase n=1 Tax=Acuticoccus kalidii TaxID=2910977 RepID=UPI001F1F3A50|nr:M20/M25/M40 family metallo-hydrolase [Acuticoccus kalidii]MCF3932541.1 M20/M25/M40 family metallo-hydrolase [Acuticoccus kalidii]